MEDGSQEGGANISFPFTDSAVVTSVLLSDDLVLDELPNTPGGRCSTRWLLRGLMAAWSSVLLLRMILSRCPVPMVEDSEQIVEVEVLENQFQVIKNSTNEILNEVNYEMETVILTLSYDVLDKNSLASGQPVNIEVRLEREDEVF